MSGVTDTEQIAQQIAAQGREALLARLRPAFERAAAAHADILQIPPERLEQMISDAADRADGLQWRRALAGLAVDRLGVELSEALRHPVVVRAQELLGVPAYEDAFGAEAAGGSPGSGFAAPAAPTPLAAQPEATFREPEPAPPVASEPSYLGQPAYPEPEAEPAPAAEPSYLGQPAYPEPEAETEPEAAPADSPPSPPAGGRPYWEVEDGSPEPSLPEEPPVSTMPPFAAEPPAFGSGSLESSSAEAADEPLGEQDQAPSAGEAHDAEPVTALHDAPAPTTQFPSPDPGTVHLPAVHLGGIANLAPGETGLELRFADPGLDIAREDDAVLGRIAWDEIRSIEVAAPGRLRRRRKDPEAKLVVRTERGDASFRIPGSEEDELRMQLAPALTRIQPQG